MTEATGIPEELTNKIVQALKGADYLGTLLKVDAEVETKIREYEQKSFTPIQGNLFKGFETERQPISFAQAKLSVLEKLERFLARCTSGDDLGLRLRGEQLAAGIRFIRMIRENSYDLVVGNPPYQGTSKMVDAKYVAMYYPKGKADLYAAFLERGLQLARVGGMSALLTMRNWMFIQQFTQIREYLLEKFDFRALGDVDRGAFNEVPNEVLAVVMSVFQKVPPSREISVAIQPTPLDDNSYDRQRTKRKRAAVLAQVGRFEFRSDGFAGIKAKPLVYWWTQEDICEYNNTPKLEDYAPVRGGMGTGDNTRFLRKPWEVSVAKIYISNIDCGDFPKKLFLWFPYIKGANGRVWIEGIDDVVSWKKHGLEVKNYNQMLYGSYSRTIKNEAWYCLRGVAFSMIGYGFSGRIHRYRSIIGNKGSSVFPQSLPKIVCLLNCKKAKNVLASLNPGIGFEIGDVNRLPLFPIESADEIFAKLDEAFTEHEAARETSVEFKQPGASAWNYAQQWAQQAVDREPRTALPEWKPVYEEPPAINWVSYTVGVALGRFGADGEGILNTPSIGTLPHGILYLSTYSEQDSLNHPACQPIHNAWQQHGTTIAKGTPLRKWLRLSFFKDVHLEMYESRPIYFPLSSTKKNFVAFVSIHRWADDTLQTLLADYLKPELNTLQGELSDLLEARNRGDRKSQADAEKRYSEVQQLYNELKEFCDRVTQCAEQGSPPANPKDTPREADARFKLDLNDGVMINSAALWSLLEPQWSQPKKWWSELCNAQGKKDYDWAHLAVRYFPNRVEEKCKKDPSLAVAHGVFWKSHSVKAYEWELRLQDEIAPDFTIDEENSHALREAFENEYPELVKKLREAEEKRRERKRKKQELEDYGPLFEEEPEKPPLEQA